MIQSRIFELSRFKQHALYKEAGSETILFIHGNGSSSEFWRDIIEMLPETLAAIAPDIRGYGLSEAVPIHAENGFLDIVSDLVELLDLLELERVHVIGHSLGGSIMYPLVAHHPRRFKSMIFINPGSPYGFGGSKGVNGEPCYADFTGSGGGLANPEFVKRLQSKDRSSEDPNASPREVMNSFYWKPPFEPENMDELLEALLNMQVGEHYYPGDFEISDKYPFVKPGSFGPLNAASPKYLKSVVNDFIENTSEIPLLWLRGEDDQIVSDASLFDYGTLGALGLIEGYPGEDVFPPQPMVSQTRAVFEEREKKGGSYKEIVIKDCGHSPYIEKPTEFMRHMMGFLNA